MDNLNNEVEKNSILEKKNNLLTLELKKKETQFNNIQETCRKQEKEIISLIGENNKLNYNNNDSLLLIKEIKNKNEDIFQDYEDLKHKMDSIKEVFKIDDDLEKILSEFKQNVNDEPNYINDDEMKIDYINNKDINNYINSNNKVNHIYNFNNEEDNNNHFPLDFQNVNNKKIIEESSKKYNRNFIYDTSNENKVEITMDKKYDFFINKGK